MQAGKRVEHNSLQDQYEREKIHRVQHQHDQWGGAETTRMQDQ